MSLRCIVIAVLVVDFNDVLLRFNCAVVIHGCKKGGKCHDTWFMSVVLEFSWVFCFFGIPLGGLWMCVLVECSKRRSTQSIEGS